MSETKSTNTDGGASPSTDVLGTGLALAKQPALGKPLKEETDVERLRKDVDFLWSLLDDIDTTGDIAKENEKSYRARVERIQRRRFERISSDGYDLFVVPNSN